MFFRSPLLLSKTGLNWKILYVGTVKELIAQVIFIHSRNLSQSKHRLWKTSTDNFTELYFIIIGTFLKLIFYPSVNPKVYRKDIPNLYIILYINSLVSHISFIVLKHVWDQLFTVDTIWNIGETGDIYPILAMHKLLFSNKWVCYIP